MSNKNKEIYEFSRYRLEVAERKLLRDAKPVSLTDKAFDTLCVLVSRSGELVTKDEILALVWPNTVVEENNLDQKISIIRRVLSEKARGKETFIETVRGHGYRFVSEVRSVEERHHQIESNRDLVSSPSYQRQVTSRPVALLSQKTGNVVAVKNWPHSEEVPALPDYGTLKASADDTDLSGSISRRRILQAALFSAFVLITVYASWVALTSAGTSGHIESIAVLPFVNETGSVENEYLADGMTEAMISSLSQVPGLSVKARSSVFRYKGSKMNPDSIAKELSVQGMLMGVLRSRDNEFTLSVELVANRTSNTSWSKRYTSSESELMTLQSDVARDVSNELRSRLSKTDELKVTKRFTSDVEANRLYLQGLYHWNKRTAEDIRKSIELFDEASKKDTSYARAYAGLAMAYLILPDYDQGLSREEFQQINLKLRGAVARARELDDTLPEVHALAATIKEEEWDFPGAEAEYKKAIELDPNFASGYHWYSRLLGALGRNEDAIEKVNRARDLDPFSRSIAFNVGARLADARRFDDAIEQYKRVLEMEPEHPLTHLLLANAYDAKGMLSDAIPEYRKAWVLLEKESEESAKHKASELENSLSTGGQSAYWKKRLEFSKQDYEKGIGKAFTIAVCYARLREERSMYEQLERSLAAHESDLIWIKAESAFDEIRNDERFVDLLRRIGLA